jgi:hypothetical protein
VGVAGVGVHSGDDPVRGGAFHDLPAPVGAIRTFCGFDVLAGDQRQQRDRFGGFRVEFGVGEVSQDLVGVGDQGVDQLGAGQEREHATLGQQVPGQ